ncbi:MAG TPA: (2Fe-2S)-binding protein [Alphaproteobacteria bacterium]|nr:(2Fe-2S)-binding protein [Alphaproteobacteria bacterium]
MDQVEITFLLNGVTQRRMVQPNRVLIDLLRGEFGLLGTKLGCDQAVCGACTVLADGDPVAACATFAFEIDGREVRTIEGLSEDKLHPVQQAFVDNAAFQCGYCTPGMILLAAALLDREPDPDEATIRNWLSANICRCTGYKMIVEAVQQAAAAGRGRGRAK